MKTTTETHTLMTFDTFKAFMDLMDSIEDMDIEQRQHLRTCILNLMEMAAKDALKLGTITMEVQNEEPEAEEPEPKTGTGSLSGWLTYDQTMLDMGYDTILGWLLTSAPDYLLSLKDPIEDTKRDGCACTAEASRQGYEVIKVAAPPWMQKRGLATVNAYPVEVIADRFRQKGVTS